ncbi:MTP3 [Symbiodinium pilosum]|uniref:MTP3 protein n=1 Tax=Symbiodinium pilosum TaxID=2952 RepID=A0A812RQE5_SYMPI|nr:MTP3 [Symbiodinium pilosum]
MSVVQPHAGTARLEFNQTSVQMFDSAVCLRCSFSSLRVTCPFRLEFVGRSATMGRQEVLLTADVNSLDDFSDELVMDETKFLRSRCGRLLLAFWGSSNTLAGIYANLSYHCIFQSLWSKCEAWDILAGRPCSDDLDSCLGLHSYALQLTLRSGKVELSHDRAGSFGAVAASTVPGNIAVVQTKDPGKLQDSAEELRRHGKVNAEAASNDFKQLNVCTGAWHGCWCLVNAPARKHLSDHMLVPMHPPAKYSMADSSLQVSAAKRSASNTGYLSKVKHGSESGFVMQELVKLLVFRSTKSDFVFVDATVFDEHGWRSQSLLRHEQMKAKVVGAQQETVRQDHALLQMVQIRNESSQKAMLVLRWVAAATIAAVQLDTKRREMHSKLLLQNGASIARQSRASRVQKSWIVGDEADGAIVHDAVQAGVREQEAMSIVKCTTRFATVMCVMIAIVKVSIYLYSGSEVVRTSALDSLGDLMANMITLYTGYRMTHVDFKKYPVGQKKFQSIGCLVFSTLMFALMFGNALSNLESLIESKDDIGHKAITRFFQQTGSVSEFSQWRADLECTDEEECTWRSPTDNAAKIQNPLKKFFEVHGDEAEKAMYANEPAELTRGEVVQQIADYENEAEQWQQLKTQNLFLGCCATYKLCLWLYCLLYAIPKSGSSVLVALATDKRNDFICTSFVITSTFFAAIFPDFTGKFIANEKVDPFVSLLLSFFIMYTWSELMVEHMTVLSEQVGNDEFCEGVRKEVFDVVKGSPCGVAGDDIKVYMSGMGHTIEVTLTVNPGTTQFAVVAELVQKLRNRLRPLEDVDRVLIMTVQTYHGA